MVISLWFWSLLLNFISGSLPIYIPKYFRCSWFSEWHCNPVALDDLHVVACKKLAWKVFGSDLPKSFSVSPPPVMKASMLCVYQHFGLSLFLFATNIFRVLLWRIRKSQWMEGYFDQKSSLANGLKGSVCWCKAFFQYLSQRLFSWPNVEMVSGPQWSSHGSYPVPSDGPSHGQGSRGVWRRTGDEFWCQCCQTVVLNAFLTKTVF